MPRLFIPPSLKESFKLNTAKQTHEDRLRISIEGAKRVSELIDILYTFLRDFSALVKEPDLNDFLRKELVSVLYNQNVSTAEEIQLLFLLGDLQDPKGENITETVRKLRNITQIVEEINILSYKRRLLSICRKNSR